MQNQKRFRNTSRSFGVVIPEMGNFHEERLPCGRPRRFPKFELIALCHDLFVRYGYHGTTIRMITEAANISISSLYACLGNKSEIYGAALEYARAQQFDRLKALDGFSFDNMPPDQGPFDRQFDGQPTSRPKGHRNFENNSDARNFVEATFVRGLVTSALFERVRYCFIAAKICSQAIEDIVDYLGLSTARRLLYRAFRIQRTFANIPI